MREIAAHFLRMEDQDNGWLSVKARQSLEGHSQMPADSERGTSLRNNLVHFRIYVFYPRRGPGS